MRDTQRAPGGIVEFRTLGPRRVRAEEAPVRVERPVTPAFCEDNRGEKQAEKYD